MAHYPDTDERLALAENCERCPDLVACRNRISWGVGPRDASVVVAAGVEGVLSLRDAGIEPETTFAAGDVAAEAAARGVDAVVVTTADEVGRVTDALRDGDVLYEVTEAGAAVGPEFRDAGDGTAGDTA